MELTPVESSHIASIGYLEAERVLLVRYKDGRVYAWPECHPAAWDNLRNSNSKGQTLAHWPKGILIAKGVMPTESISSTSATGPGDNEAPSPGPLNVIDEDADKCCRSYLTRIHVTNNVGIEVRSLSCCDCGQEFRAEMVGPTRYWRIVPAFAVRRRT